MMQGMDGGLISFSGKFSASIKFYEGTPAIFVNGHPFCGSAVAFRNYKPGGVKNFRKIYAPPSLRFTRPEIVMLNLQPVIITAYEENIMIIEKAFEDMFEENPASLGAIHLNLQPGSEWVASHPEEMTKYDIPVDWRQTKAEAVSWASKTWHSESIRFVQKSCDYLHRKFNGRIIIYYVGFGKSGENGTYSYLHNDKRLYCGDFSECMINYFRKKLKNYYNNDEKALRKAWGDNSVTFENALPPGRIERLRSEWFTFRSHGRSQTADYFRANSDAVEEYVISLAKSVKEATNNESLTASSIGSYLDAGLHSFMICHMNSLSFKRAISSTFLDMFQSPASYALRDLGNGDTTSMIPLGMLKNAGKIWLRDFDTRTSLAAEMNENHPVGMLWKSPRNTWEDRQVLIRDTAYSLIKGGAFWWHEINPGMYKLPEHIETVEHMHRIGRMTVHAGKETMPGLCILTDNESLFRQSNSNRLVYLMNYEARRLHWTRAGMASEIYHLDDISHEKMPAHRVLMVTNAFCITDKQKDNIIMFARKNRAAVIWLVAPGIQTDKGFDLSRTSEITGFKICSSDIECYPGISLLHGRHPLSRPDSGDNNLLFQFGGGRNETDDSGAKSTGPQFYIDAQGDNECVVLGMLSGLNEPGLAVKDMGDWTSIYCAAPYVHNAFLRATGKYTGAHIYFDDDDAFHVSSELMLLNARTAGTKNVLWHCPAEIAVDLYTGKVIAKKKEFLKFRLKTRESKFIFTGTEKKYTKIAKFL